MLLHISPAKLLPGDVLSFGVRGYVCLCTSVEQALYWAYELYAEGRREAGLQNLHLYKVKVGGNGLVEDCRGHYALEYPGVEVAAEEVAPHVGDMDGEVISRNQATVQSEVPLDFTSAVEWYGKYILRDSDWRSPRRAL